MHELSGVSLSFLKDGHWGSVHRVASLSSRRGSTTRSRRIVPPSDELEEDELCDELFYEDDEVAKLDDYVDADAEAGEDIRDRLFHAEQDSEWAMRASGRAYRIDRSSA